MFFGQYEHTIDEKGRLTIPARYRELVGYSAYITKGFEQNLMVLPPSAFQLVSDNINHISITDPAGRDLKHKFYSNGFQIDVDKAGRILIPSILREMVGIKSEAMVVGNGTHFEIWARELWLKKNADLQNSEADIEKFAQFNIPL
jgi:MraZ protein